MINNKSFEGLQTIEHDQLARIVGGANNDKGDDGPVTPKDVGAAVGGALGGLGGAALGSIVPGVGTAVGGAAGGAAGAIAGGALFDSINRIPADKAGKLVESGAMNGI